MWGDIYQEALLHLTVVGPIPASVVVSGHLNGGVHSPVSGLQGTGSDQVVEIEAVTATGYILTVNEYQHADIFWALRGVSLPFLSSFRLVLKPSLICYVSRAVTRPLPLLLP